MRAAAPGFVPALGSSYPGPVDILLAAAAVVVAVVAWTAWESTMVRRLARDTRPLQRRNAAVAGAHRLTVVAQLGLVAVAVVVAGLVDVPLWWTADALTPPAVGAVAAAALVAAAGVALWWSARRGHRPQDRRALLAVAATAFATEVLLRGFGLGLLDVAGWPVTAAVLVTSVGTGLLQAWRAGTGNRAYGFVLATLLGFGLGLVVLLTGSVLAAAAIHVAVAALVLGRTFPARDHAPGCACGSDHDHGAATTTTSTSTATATATATSSGAGTARVSAVGADPGATNATGVTEAAGAAGTAPAHDHSTCGSTCDHAGSPACAVCPLSTARV